jgi:ABC-type Fe3+-hydroxamate transport system substrate-binding protein
MKKILLYVCAMCIVFSSCQKNIFKQKNKKSISITEFKKFLENNFQTKDGEYLCDSVLIDGKPATLTGGITITNNEASFVEIGKDYKRTVYIIPPTTAPTLLYERDGVADITIANNYRPLMMLWEHRIRVSYDIKPSFASDPTPTKILIIGKSKN